jgi:hypothetical protein
MRAGFLRRVASAFVDIFIAVLVVYLAFVLVGRPILENRVEHFDTINSRLETVMASTDEDLQTIDQRDDENKRDQIAVLNHLSALDQSVYERLLVDYYSGSLFFYIIGTLLILTVLILSFKGQTPGRKLLRIELVGNVTLLNIVIHDLLLKYLLFIALMLFNLYYAMIIIPIYILLDLFMIILGKNKTTIRDNLSKITLNYSPKRKI